MVRNRVSALLPSSRFQMVLLMESERISPGRLWSIYSNRRGYTVTVRRVVPDEAPHISQAITDLAGQASLILTTGGTGFGPRDVTPEATRAVLDREAPGLVVVDAVRRQSGRTRWRLSPEVSAGTCGSSLVVNLPGSPRGAVENLSALLPILPHALTLLAGDTEHRPQPSEAASEAARAGTLHTLGEQGR